MANKVSIRAEFQDGVTRKLNNVSRAFDKLGGPGSGASLFGNVGAKAIAAGFNLVANAASKAVDFAFDSIDAFSKLEQATGALESVFGDAGGTLEKFAETSAISAGLSRRAVFEMAAPIGAMLQSMGMDVDDAATTVVNLEQRAADLAATFGGPTTDAIGAIGALLRGERDPIERYGVSIKAADVNARILALGLDTSTTAARKNAEATASLQLLMEQTSAVSGQFSRETETLAGKQAIATARMEDAQAALGEKLAPLMITFTDFMITTGIPAIEALATATSKAAQAFEFLFHWMERSGASAKKWTPSFRAARDAWNTSGGATGGRIGGKAEGGWVGLGGPEIVMVGEKGPEYVVPNDQLGRAGGSQIVETRVFLDGREIARQVDRRLGPKFAQAARTGTAT